MRRLKFFKPRHDARAVLSTYTPPQSHYFSQTHDHCVDERIFKRPRHLRIAENIWRGRCEMSRRRVQL